MLLEKALKDFIEFHEVGNQSRYTIRNYRDYVGSFVEWLQSEHGMTDTDDLRVVHLRGWIAYLQKVPGERGKMLKDSTIHLSGVCVLAFCHWLEYEEITSHAQDDEPLCVNDS